MQRLEADIARLRRKLGLGPGMQDWAEGSDDYTVRQMRRRAALFALSYV
jgi:hypothetical protein